MISVIISKVRTREKGGGVEFLKEMENDTRKSFSKLAKVNLIWSYRNIVICSLSCWSKYICRQPLVLYHACYTMTIIRPKFKEMQNLGINKKQLTIGKDIATIISHALLVHRP